MKTAEDFLRENNSSDFESLTKKQLKRARVTAITLGSATIISLIFLIYAFIQKVEADKSRDLLMRSATQLEAQRRLTTESKRNAEMQMKLAAENDAALMQQLQLVEQQLEACQKKNELISVNVQPD
jgi:hypothetical protein